MKSIIKTLIISCVVALGAATWSSCGNMHMSSNAGVNVNFGPGGPHVDPYFNVGLHSGGGRYY